MTLEQLHMETGLNKVEFAINFLQKHEPLEGYYFADSGGKDSSVVRDLLIRAGVKYDAHFCVSPIDPPQLYRFIKSFHPETSFDVYAKNFWQKVVEKSLPTRRARWCCEYIKEAGGRGRHVVVGNRWDESVSRSKQPYISAHKTQPGKILYRPILNFTHYDVWQYIRLFSVPYCYLYDEGAQRKGYGEGYFKRLGCVLCPFSNELERETQYFPHIVKHWRQACDRIVEETKARGYTTKTGKPVRIRFETGADLFAWWTKRKPKKL